MAQFQENNKHATLFKDLTVPLGGVVTSFAEDPIAEDSTVPDAGSPEESILVHRHTGNQESLPASVIHALPLVKRLLSPLRKYTGFGS